jgi:hypothetical protein
LIRHSQQPNRAPPLSTATSSSGSRRHSATPCACIITSLRSQRAGDAEVEAALQKRPTEIRCRTRRLFSDRRVSEDDLHKSHPRQAAALAALCGAARSLKD